MRQPRRNYTPIRLGYEHEQQNRGGELCLLWLEVRRYIARFVSQDVPHFMNWLRSLPKEDER